MLFENLLRPRMDGVRFAGFLPGVIQKDGRPYDSDRCTHVDDFEATGAFAQFYSLFSPKKDSSMIPILVTLARGRLIEAGVTSSDLFAFSSDTIFVGAKVLRGGHGLVYVQMTESDLARNTGNLVIKAPVLDRVSPTESNEVLHLLGKRNTQILEQVKFSGQVDQARYRGVKLLRREGEQGLEPYAIEVERRGSGKVMALLTDSTLKSGKIASRERPLVGVWRVHAPSDDQASATLCVLPLPSILPDQAVSEEDYRSA